MGITAHKLNKNLKFDSKTPQFDDPAANARNHPVMPEPWKLDV